MDEEKIQEVSDSLRRKAGKKKVSENEDKTKKRLKKTLLRRDNAIKLIEEYQDDTGVPNDDEVDGSFLSESDIEIELNEFREKDNNDV